MPSPKRLRLLLVVLECGWQVPSSDIESIEKEEGGREVFPSGHESNSCRTGCPSFWA